MTQFVYGPQQRLEKLGVAVHEALARSVLSRATRQAGAHDSHALIDLTEVGARCNKEIEF